MRDAGHKPKKRDGTTKSGTGGHPRDVFVALELRQTAVRLKSCLFQTLAVPLDVYNELKSLPLDKGKCFCGSVLFMLLHHLKDLQKTERK
ncbi:hypothetical protein WMY93_033005 [Mugilogobius chulae]|uniref:Uncharacterized protein n=1 Tax=Mugilogobius chulae TaxID=88201 RepID=A0AAW0MU17_9GOBI